MELFLYNNQIAKTLIKQFNNDTLFINDMKKKKILLSNDTATAN
jgi:hypothetical protein